MKGWFAFWDLRENKLSTKNLSVNNLKINIYDLKNKTKNLFPYYCYHVTNIKKDKW